MDGQASCKKATVKTEVAYSNVSALALCQSYASVAEAVYWQFIFSSNSNEIYSHITSSENSFTKFV